jgi:hypothetical protein
MTLDGQKRKSDARAVILSEAKDLAATKVAGPESLREPLRQRRRSSGRRGRWPKRFRFIRARPRGLQSAIAASARLPRDGKDAHSRRSGRKNVLVRRHRILWRPRGRPRKTGGLFGKRPRRPEENQGAEPSPDLYRLPAYRLTHPHFYSHSRGAFSSSSSSTR